MTEAKAGKRPPPHQSALQAPVAASERTVEEQALVDGRRGRARLRRPPKVRETPDGKNIFEPDSDDRELWSARIEAATGVDFDLAMTALNQAARCIRGSGADTVNQVLASLHAIGPRDGVELMLATQMTSTHAVALDILKRLAVEQPSLEVYDSVANRATKLLRTFTAQVEALGRYRNGGKQQVVVQHQHVAVNANQAAVAIGCTPGGGGAVQSNGQPNADQITHAPITPMRGTHSKIDAMSVPGNAER